MGAAGHKREFFRLAGSSKGARERKKRREEEAEGSYYYCGGLRIRRRERSFWVGCFFFFVKIIRWWKGGESRFPGRGARCGDYILFSFCKGLCVTENSIFEPMGFAFRMCIQSSELAARFVYYANDISVVVFVLELNIFLLSFFLSWLSSADIEIIGNWLI